MQRSVQGRQLHAHCSSAGYDCIVMSVTPLSIVPRGVTLPPASQSVYVIFDHSSLQKRDLKAILRKCVHVMVPVRSNKALLHDCESLLEGWSLPYMPY